MDNSKTKQIILGKVTDIFFDLCIIFIFLISVGAVLISENLNIKASFTFLMIACFFVFIGLFYTTKKLDKKYKFQVLNNKNSEELLFSTKLFPISNESLLRSKIIRWKIYLLSPQKETKWNKNIIRLRNKILPKINQEINIIDKITFYLAILSGCLWLVCLFI